MITGIPSHGKSEWLDALTMNLAMKADWSFGVFSPENQPIELHLRKLAKKVVGKPFDRGPIERMSRDELDNAIDWLNKKFAFVLPEEPAVDCILDLAKVLVFRKGVVSAEFQRPDLSEQAIMHAAVPLSLEADEAA